MDVISLRLLRHLACIAILFGLTGHFALAQTAAPSTPGTNGPPSATPPAAAPTPVTPSTKTAPSAAEPPAAEAPEGKPGNTEIEPNGTPGIPDNATTESVTVPARPLILIIGTSSYDDAFKSVKASIETVKAAMTKAGLKPTGHPITIFSEPDDKGFKYKVGVPLAAKPDGAPDYGPKISIGESPSGKAIKFQHRGAYDDIDSTYDVITAYLDAKGLKVDNPYIEEYLTDLTTPDDPNLQVDIYVFVK